MKEQFAAEEKERAYKAQQMQEMLVKAKKEAEIQAEEARAGKMVHRTRWRSLKVEIDPRRNIGYFPRRPANA